VSGLLEGRVAVVTGASSGIGRGIAVRFAQEGAALVVIADLRQEPREGGDFTAVVVQEAGARAEFVTCDVSDPAQLEGVVARAVELGGRLDVMVNNAGIIGPTDFLNASKADFDAVMGVNVAGVYFGCQAAARAMIPRGSGSIVNVSSVGGIRGSSKFAAYSASKGAVRLLTYSLGELLGPHGIRVNAIHPGVIDTQMNRVDTGPACRTTWPAPQSSSPATSRLTSTVHRWWLTAAASRHDRKGFRARGRVQARRSDVCPNHECPRAGGRLGCL
jgi:NAD(P)-dependent dehydrogenase (short-subunit alcohol dehydrogenase family)